MANRIYELKKQMRTIGEELIPLYEQQWDYNSGSPEKKALDMEIEKIYSKSIPIKEELVPLIIKDAKVIEARSASGKYTFAKIADNCWARWLRGLGTPLEIINNDGIEDYLNYFFDLYEDAISPVAIDRLASPFGDFIEFSYEDYPDEVHSYCKKISDTAWIAADYNVYNLEDFDPNEKIFAETDLYEIEDWHECYYEIKVDKDFREELHFWNEEWVEKY